MNNRKNSLLPVLITSLCMGFALQGCNATTENSKKSASIERIDQQAVSALYHGGFRAYLHNIAPNGTMSSINNGKVIDRPMWLTRSSFVRGTVLQGRRGKSVSGCQFIAARVELDGQIETADWLATTIGKGHCGTRLRNFWIIQQSKSSPVKVLLEGRASHVSVYKPDKSQQSKVGIRSSAQIRVKNGDQLADGSWVQVNSPDNKNVEISCNYHYQLQNGVYVVTDKSVEVSVPTGSMLNSHTPEMFWQPIDDPRYQCAF